MILNNLPSVAISIFPTIFPKRFPAKLSKREATVIRPAEKEKIEKHYPLHPHFAIKSQKHSFGAQTKRL